MSDVLPGAASDRASKAPLGCVCLKEGREYVSVTVAHSQKRVWSPAKTLH